jgi:predicted nuclease of predicted toxin-antitoxin system
MARFLLDEQLPPALERLLRKAGHEAVHVRHIGLAAASDERIWDEALARQAILVTKDVDFVDRLTTSGSGPPLLWIKLGNTTPRALWVKLEPLLNEIVAGFAKGETLIEVV